MEKEYIVTIKNSVDWQQLHNDIISQYGTDSIPARSVDIVKLRPSNPFNTHYALTDDEAAKLRTDVRVLAVEEKPPRDYWKLRSTASALQAGFSRHTIRNRTLLSNYNYNLNGSNVDIVISDSGINVNHTEFANRISLVSWQGGGTHNTDSDTFSQHGSHVASTTAGNTHGWAKGANIIPLKVNIGLANSSVITDGLDVEDSMDAIYEWHKNKNTPTVVNMSWGGGFREVGDASIIDAALATNLIQIVHRGTTYTPTTVANAKSLYGLDVIPYNGKYYIPARIDSVDTDLEWLTNYTYNPSIGNNNPCSIHVAVAAGNENYHVSSPTDIGWDNRIIDTTTGYALYYQRGTSPGWQNSTSLPGETVFFNVGSINWDSGSDVSSTFSNKGPGIDIWAVGQAVRGANGANNTGFKNLSGTSMASPQVAGVMACYLEVYPQLTPSQLKNKIINDCSQNYMEDSGVTSYTTTTSIQGSPNRILYNRYNYANALTIS